MYEVLTLDNWETEYNPILDEDGQEIYHEPRDKQLQIKLDSLAKAQGTEPHQHVWTRVEGDSGKLVLINGWHICNRLDYLICKQPWGDGTDEDKDIYIEVKYEEE